MSVEPPRLWLASRSPRRLQLLAEAGFDPQVAASGFDDSGMSPAPGQRIEDWTVELALLKARGAAQRLRHQGKAGLVIGADTVGEHDGRILGQPRGREHAQEMLLSTSGRTHRVITGVAVVPLNTATMTVFVDAATVRMGPLHPRLVEEYLDSQQWQGKAAAYNLIERLEAGWPIEYDGDPTTIMGLPMRRLTVVLAERYGLRPRT